MAVKIDINLINAFIPEDLVLVLWLIGVIFYVLIELSLKGYIDLFEIRYYNNN